MQPCRLLRRPVPDFLFDYIVYQLFFVCSPFVVIHYIFCLLVGYYVSEQMELFSMHTTCCQMLWCRLKNNRKLKNELSENTSRQTGYLFCSAMRSCSAFLSILNCLRNSSGLLGSFFISDLS